MRSSLFLLFAAALAGGCASRGTEDQMRLSNSRLVDEMRARELTRGADRGAGSARGAEVLVYNPDKSFDIGQATRTSSKTYAAGSARTKDFRFDQKVRPTGFQTRGYSGSKSSTFSDNKFATTGARTTGNYEIPNAGKRADTKTVDAGEAREASRTMASRNLPDGDREFLGKESEKLKKPVDPKDAADWRGAGATTGGEVGASKGGRTYTTPAERFSDLRELSLEDVRGILNTNK